MIPAGRIVKPVFLILLALPIAPAAQAKISKGTEISVMTYNVHGLPWPFARDREFAFAQIQNRLLEMRRHSTQPHIVVLQEAFTDSAKAIGARSGYRFIANGPSRDMAGSAIPTAKDNSFAAAARFFKGEKSGKWLDSGLQILSDYPITSIRRAAFPAFACAGFDCLANKGILLVTIAVPGSSTPVTVATTHMNSRHASGVSQERSFYAYRRQADAINEFLALHRDTRGPVIFAGDFNASSAQRRSYLQDFGASSLSVRNTFKVYSALHNCLSLGRPCGSSMPPIATYIQKRSRDWQFYANGLGTTIRAVRVQVPFGKDQAGGMLSDHFGYDIVYRLSAIVARTETAT